VTAAHPGPAAATLPAAMRDAILAHARAGYPNEACGLIIGDRPASEAGFPLRFEATRNAAESPYRYDIAPDDLYRISVAADDADQIIWGIVHSHVRSPAVPSPTDVGLAFYPDALYVLVSLTDESVRAWRIVDGGTHEVELTE